MKNKTIEITIEEVIALNDIYNGMSHEGHLKEVQVFKNFISKIPKIETKVEYVWKEEEDESPEDMAGHDYELIPEIIFVEGGKFTMGNKDYANTQPPHEVEVDSFYIGKYPVTVSQFVYFLNNHNSDRFNEHISIPLVQEMLLKVCGILKYSSKEYIISDGCENLPIAYITQYIAKEYCDWLTSITGYVHRLPTEAEWEYASKGYLIPEDNEVDEILKVWKEGYSNSRKDL